VSLVVEKLSFSFFIQDGKRRKKMALAVFGFAQWTALLL